MSCCVLLSFCVLCCVLLCRGVVWCGVSCRVESRGVEGGRGGGGVGGSGRIISVQIIFSLIRLREKNIYICLPTYRYSRFGVQVAFFALRFDRSICFYIFFDPPPLPPTRSNVRLLRTADKLRSLPGMKGGISPL